MRFIATIAAGVFATVASAQGITEPFYLTFETDSGEEYPATIAEVSRGAEILSAWNSYMTKFVIDVDVMRFAGEDRPNTLNDGLEPGSIVGFGNEEEVDEEAAKIQNVEGPDGKVYLVKMGANDTMGWYSEPSVNNNPNNVYWYGAGSDKANSRLRIDMELPTGGE